MSDITYKLQAVVDDEVIYEIERPTTAEIEGMFSRAEYAVEKKLDQQLEEEEDYYADVLGLPHDDDSEYQRDQEVGAIDNIETEQPF